MNLIHRTRQKRIFHLEDREKQLLLAVLKQYPLIPPGHQPLSRSAVSTEQEANQRLLDEALAEQRQENRLRLQKLLHAPRRFQRMETGWRLALSFSEMDWLLQVLNDVRVGSWIILGSPETDLWDFEPNDANAAHAWTMEMAAYFQAHLLEAMEGGEK